MINFFVLTLVVVLFCLIYVLWQQVKQQKTFRAKPKLDKSLDRQLLTMLNGDRQAALRLLRGAKKNNPGRSYLFTTKR
ncbi:MAG: hypothetical protein AAFQ41_01370 [Cyanobacteria bacterium J06623_7]